MDKDKYMTGKYQDQDLALNDKYWETMNTEKNHRYLNGTSHFKDI